MQLELLENKLIGRLRGKIHKFPDKYNASFGNTSFALHRKRKLWNTLQKNIAHYNLDIPFIYNLVWLLSKSYQIKYESTITTLIQIIQLIFSKSNSEQQKKIYEIILELQTLFNRAKLTKQQLLLLELKLNILEFLSK